MTTRTSTSTRTHRSRMRIRTQEAKVRRRLIAYLRNSGYLEQFVKNGVPLGDEGDVDGDDEQTKTIQVGRS